MKLIRTYALPALIIAAVILVTFYLGLKAWGNWYDEWGGLNASYEVTDGYCTIAVAKVEGEILSYATEDERYTYAITTGDDLLDFFERAEYDPGVYGIMLEIDSGGGSPAPALEVADRIAQIDIPVAAYVGDVAASSAYLIASAADTIIANSFADVGSIGVTMSYLSMAQQNTDAGLEYISLSTGEFKDAGSPDKPLTEAERAIFERNLGVWHDVFVERVAANRELPVEQVDALADGSSWAASLAVENGLIDQVGNRDTVREWFAAQLGMPVEDIVLCRAS